MCDDRLLCFVTVKVTLKARNKIIHNFTTGTGYVLLELNVYCFKKA